MELKPRDRIVQLKVVYYGPAVCGKTTNLQMLHAAAQGRHRGELITVNSQQDRTILFDLLPLRGVGFHGFDIRFQLVAVPGQAPYAATRRLVMRGADAVVFVANSAADRLEENMASLQEMNENLSANGLDPATIPIVFQYNKRDLPEVLVGRGADRARSTARRAPWLEAVAIRGDGVIETLGARARARRWPTSRRSTGAWRSGRARRCRPGRGAPSSRCSAARRSREPGCRPAEGGDAEDLRRVQVAAPRLPRGARAPTARQGARRAPTSRRRCS